MRGRKYRKNMRILRKIWNRIKSFFSNTFKINLARNTIKNSQIKISNGDLIQMTNVVDLNTKESVEEFEKRITNFMQDKLLVDVSDDRFQFYINQSLLILKLNDSETKRNVLKELLLRKFSNKDIHDDSDAPTTIALDAMKYMTDNTLKRLCVHRMITNVLPSIVFEGKQHIIENISNFIKITGFLDATEIMNLRRLGLLFDMGMRTYSYTEILEYMNISDQNNNSLFWSSSLSPAGIELTDITLENFLHLHGPFDHWLHVNNQSLHLGKLIVDEDLTVMKNIVANGEVSSGGVAEDI